MPYGDIDRGGGGGGGGGKTGPGNGLLPEGTKLLLESMLTSL